MTEEKKPANHHMEHLDKLYGEGPIDVTKGMDHVVSLIQQINSGRRKVINHPAVDLQEQAGQSSRTVLKDSPLGQSGQSLRTARTVLESGLDSPEGQPGQSLGTAKEDSLKGQSGLSSLSSIASPGIMDKEAYRGKIASLSSKNYKRIAAYLQKINQRTFFTSFPLLEDELEIPYGTIRKGFRVLKEEGIIDTESHYDRASKTQGQLVTFLGPIRDERTVQEDSLVERTDFASKIDRDFKEEPKNLSIKDRLLKWDDEYLKLMFPNIFKIPFTADNFRSVINARDLAGKSLEHLPLWMEWMEFDAEKGDLTDKDGAAVGSGFVFRCLTMKGYRRPKDWHDPDQHTQEEELKRLKNLEESRSELLKRYKEDWLARLKPAEKEKLVFLGRNNGKDSYIAEQIALGSVFNKYHLEFIEVMKGDPFKALPDDFFKEK